MQKWLYTHFYRTLDPESGKWRWWPPIVFPDNPPAEDPFVSFTLQQMGSNGWELVSVVTPTAFRQEFFFKKPDT